MRNQPKYSFFKNSSYAFSGLFDIISSEKSFKIELAIIIPLLIVSVFLNLTLSEHLLLAAVLFLILVVECINSSIERAVDLTTTNYHILAKKAKDAASAAVFLSICLAGLVWISIKLKIIF